MADVTSPFGFAYPEDTDLVRDGAQDIENLATGVNDYLTGGYLYAGTRYYESSAAFLKADPLGTGDIGLRAVRVRMVGGGGAGGGMPAGSGGSGGGGGGGYCEKFITDLSTLSASEDVTRGAGGAGVVDGTGGQGGTSSFLTLTATGGGGGLVGQVTAPTTSTGGEGGVGTNGDLNIGGGAGGLGFALGTGSRENGGGFGGASALSGTSRALPRAGTGGSASNAGQLYGGGGTGVAQRTDGTNAGASGANGIVIIDCFV